MGKRAYDLGIAISLLLLLPPVLVVIAVANRRMGAPALFRQRRVGGFGRTFEILKFRTMLPGSHLSGPEITHRRDPRITRFGRFLRATKLDELPQLLSVVRGDISVVGPRPEVEKYVALWPEADRRVILSVRPGITDEAAIVFRDEEGILAGAKNPEEMHIREVIPPKLELYREYVAKQSVWRDTKLLCRTLEFVVIGAMQQIVLVGARPEGVPNMGQH